MRTFEYTIKDELGIHARPAGLLVKEANTFKSNITIKKDDKQVDSKKIFGIMGLGAKCGDTIIINAEGEDEDIAIDSLEKFVKETL